MTSADRKNLEDIADDLMGSLQVFFRRVSREGASSSAGRFDPSRVVLRAIQNHGPARMSDIGDHLCISKPYMTALVDRLIEEGLVERVRDTGDRRVVNVKITEAGKETLREFTREAREAVIGSLSSLSSEDISSLHESMNKIRIVVSKLDAERAGKHTDG